MFFSSRLLRSAQVVPSRVSERNRNVLPLVEIEMSACHSLLDNPSKHGSERPTVRWHQPRVLSKPR